MAIKKVEHTKAQMDIRGEIEGRAISLVSMTYMLKQYLKNENWLEDEEIDVPGCFWAAKYQIQAIIDLFNQLDGELFADYSDLSDALEKASSAIGLVWNAYEANDPLMLGSALQMWEATRELADKAEFNGFEYGLTA